jgi:hypothetical protein
VAAAKVCPDGTRRLLNNWRSSLAVVRGKYVPEQDQYYLHLFAKGTTGSELGESCGENGDLRDGDRVLAKERRQRVPSRRRESVLKRRLVPGREDPGARHGDAVSCSNTV